MTVPIPPLSLSSGAASAPVDSTTVFTPTSHLGGDIVFGNKSAVESKTLAILAVIGFVLWYLRKKRKKKPKKSR